MRGAIDYAARPDGTKLAYAIHGDGPGTPIVSLRPPQFSHVAREWEAGSGHHEFGQYAQGRRIIRCDPRGTGLSDRDCTEYGLAANLADLEAVLAAAGVQQIILDAISSSALVAFAFALEHPGRVERLVVQNAFVDGAAWWDNPVRRAVVNIAEVDWDLCTETWAWLVWGDERRERTLALAGYIRECIEPAAFLGMVTAEKHVNLSRELGRLDLPVLVLNHPRFARMAPEAHNAQVALAIAGAVVHSIASTADRVAAIRAFVSGRALPSAAARSSAAAPSRTPVLSPREVEVLRLMANGLTNWAIAERLVISVRTVDAHVRNIFARTGTTNRAAATAYGIRNELL